MPPQAYALAGVLVWNYARDRDGKVTISQWGRAHPVAFVAVVCWGVPHVLNGSSLTIQTVRLLNRMHR